MKFKRIEHIAIAVKSIKAMRDIFENKLGIEMEYEEHLPEHSTSLAMFPIGETYLELLQSDKPGTGTSKWIEERGEACFTFASRWRTSTLPWPNSEARASVSRRRSR